MRAYVLRVCLCLACALASVAVAVAEETAEALLSRVEAATKAVGTLTADIGMTWVALPGNDQHAFAKPNVPLERRWKGTLQFKRPNLARLETTQLESDKTKIEVSDGSNRWQWDSTSATCHKSSVEPDNPNVVLAAGWPSFFNPNFASLADGTSLKHLGVEKVDGTEYQVVEFLGPTSEIRWYIGKDDLVHRARIDTTIPGAAQRLVVRLSSMVIDRPIADSTFHFTLPEGKTIVSSDSAIDSLLPLRSNAPEFELPLPTGEQTSLTSIRKGHRLTIVNHWNMSCGACLVELPHLQKLYESVAEQGVQVVSIHFGFARAKDPQTEALLNAPNSRDFALSHTRERIAEVARDNKLSFPMLIDTRGEVGKKYHVSGFPTIYIVDEHGKIVHRMLGYNTARLRSALRELGIE